MSKKNKGKYGDKKKLFMACPPSDFFPIPPVGDYCKLANCDLCNREIIITIKQLEQIKEAKKDSSIKTISMCFYCVEDALEDKNAEDVEMIDLATDERFK